MKPLAVVKLVSIALFVLLIIPVTALAEGVERSTSFSVEGAYYTDDNKGYGVSDGGFAPISYDPVENPGRNLGSGWGSAEVQALLTHRIRIPFLVSPGALTSGNNVAFSFTGALTPVSARLEARANLTPIAFLDLFAGTMIGTGWYFGSKTNPFFFGIGNTELSGDPLPKWFPGVVMQSWAGGTFQFDLAALVPGDWTHVVTLVSPKLQYAWYSDAEKGQPWTWEADNGENFNGFMFYGTYFLGYQMPLALDTVGILVEIEQNLGYVKELSPMDANGWGSDHLLITLGPVFNFTLSESSSLAVLFQFRRERLYGEPSIFEPYFENRQAVGTYWYFYRVAFSYGLDL
jgi:hypothetical protein